MKKILNLLLSATIAFVMLGFTFSQPMQNGGLLVIANDKGAPSTLTMKELKSVLKGEKQRWGDGTKVSIAFMKTSTGTGEETAERILDMSGDQLNKFWLALVFQGKAKAPTFFSTPAELEVYISQTPGAIGIIDGQQLPKSKTILIDGKKIL